MTDFKLVELSISPHNNLGKISLYFITFIILLLFILFFFFLINMGAWPISIFMGIEYFILCVLVVCFYKKRKIQEKIEIDDKNISYKLYQEGKLRKQIYFSRYWSKINFWKKDNKSCLTLSQSGKNLELCVFLDIDSKEVIFKKIKFFLKK